MIESIRSRSTDSRGHYDLPPGFRELQPEQFWGGNITIPNISDKDFSEKILSAANEAQFTYTGYRIQSKDNGFQYHLSRYPRRAFGAVAPVEVYRNALRLLAEKFGASETEFNEEKTVEHPRFRVILGLQEGYAESRKQSVLHEIKEGTIKDIEAGKIELQKRLGDLMSYGIDFSHISNLEKLQKILEQKVLSKEHTSSEVCNVLGEGFSTAQSEIYTAGPWGTYREPAVIIEGDTSQIVQVYLLAQKFHQARFAVENIGTGQSYMVETSDCEDPDRE